MEERRTHEIEEVLLSHLVFICIPEGELEGFFRDIPDNERQNHFVIKSSCPVGLTRKLYEIHGLRNVVHCPEFLTARCAEIDAQIPSRNIIGLPGNDLPQENETGYRLAHLLKQRFPGVALLWMTSDESEAVKLFLNAFFATKVAFFNEIQAFCEKKGLDWNLVLSGILTDGRVSPFHTRVPGPDGRYGFGGACLPKDLQQAIRLLLEAGQDPHILQAAYTRNLTVDRGREVL
jgi:UDPglucose 6-dehydrogenase